MRPLASALVVVALARASDLDARLVASVEATLALYPALPKSTEAVARYLGGVLWRPATSVLVFEGKLYADARFLAASEKNRKHANFMASVLHHERVRNVASRRGVARAAAGENAPARRRYVFSGNSTGECPADVGGPASGGERPKALRRSHDGSAP